MSLPEETRESSSSPCVSVAGQALTLFVESPSLVAAMVDDIRAATARVWMETYVFADDDAGRAIAAALAERAAAGLDVRLMVDAWGSISTPSGLFDRLRAAGVQVHLFHAFAEAFGLKLLSVMNQRNHRKLLIVDHAIAYFGGMNIVDLSGIRSQADAECRNLPTSAAWRDVHVRMVGSRQADIAEMCERLWRRVHGQPPGRKLRWPATRGLFAAQEDAIFFFDSRPAFKSRRPARVLVPLIKQARKDITLSVAYFMPIGRVLGELLRAAKRGVHVRVIVPGHSDVRIVQWAACHFYEYLIKRGIHIYERKDCMLHSKVLVVDSKWSVVGSCNLDARSLRLNLEFFALIRAPQLARSLGRICSEEMRNSVRIDATYCRSRSWWQRLRDRTAWALRKWL